MSLSFLGRYSAFWVVNERGPEEKNGVINGFFGVIYTH